MTKRSISPSTVQPVAGQAAAHEADKSAAPVAQPRVAIRRFLIDDSVTEITGLLHRAYEPQMVMGLRPLAGRQDDKATLDRVLNSECYLALLDDEAPAPDDTADAAATPGAGAAPARPRIVGIILLNEHERVAFPDFFLRPGVSHFAMFGVEPGLQGLGIGRLLLERCEERARELGSTNLASAWPSPTPTSAPTTRNAATASSSTGSGPTPTTGAAS
ncbi:MAG: GNAT family N-acetyltransferase [Phycisphaerales bacterium]|nr:GNAT family N-acetyltransferase [Phycisphaerales bacterium]